jgi:4-hydroxy-3-methylbut-2-enyl diphosphate reductase
MTMEKGILRVIVAGSAGTCFGVERAIRIAEEERQPILGPLVHNPEIVSDLAAKGIRIFERYHDISKLENLREVIITAHGYPREMKKALEDRGIIIHDATCPILSNWVYRKIRRYEERGYHIILIGNPEHAEVIATRSHGKNISVVYSEEDVAALPEDMEPAVAICQTTITERKFRYLVDLIRKSRAPSLEEDDTRCKPVRKQQENVDRLARRVDAMIIIGGLNSSNTTNLARIAQEHLPRTTYHVDSPEMVKPRFFQGIETLGIGAGTSTPRSQIEAVKERIAEVYPGDVVFEEDC